jgi:hypothetical protein
LDNELADLKEELDKEDGPRIHIIVDLKVTQKCCFPARLQTIEICAVQLAEMIGDRIHVHAPDNE